MTAREYLESCMPPRKHVDDFVNPRVGLPPEDNNRGWIFDGELGWVLKDAIRFDGLDGSATFYRYEPNGARKRINFPDAPCRIHTYGNSFTHCDQVSDGETWQEVLAAHLCEPVENYGVGGYSVYQACLRMRRVESVRPAEYVILNVYCDDHYRNLDAWRTIRFGRRTPCGFPLPHMRVNVEKDAFEERPNPTPTAEDVYRLMDPDFVYETFKDDPVLQCVLAGKHQEVDPDQVPVTFGVPHSKALGEDKAVDVNKAHAEAALYATRKIIEMAEEFLAERGSKLMVVLSHNSAVVQQAMQGQPLWDQAFVDYVKTKHYPVVDLRDSHAADYEAFNIDVSTYLKRFYVGHYGPAGNFFQAMAIKDAVANWLVPKPKPYASYPPDPWH